MTTYRYETAEDDDGEWTHSIIAEDTGVIATTDDEGRAREIVTALNIAEALRDLLPKFAATLENRHV